jgi:hypothetical protein
LVVSNTSSFRLKTAHVFGCTYWMSSFKMPMKFRRKHGINR